MTGALELSVGTIEYVDTGGQGPVVVLLHGLLMDSSLWDGVIADLSPDHRCIAPTLPLGAHRQPVGRGAELSLPAIARLVGELLERLDLHDATLAGNDTGGALVQLIAAEQTARIARVVLVSCDAFDNYPPGLTGKALVLMGKLPPRAFGLVMQQMRLRPVRRLPIAFGWLTKRGDAATVRWLQPILRSQEIRREAVRLLRSIAAEPDLLVRAADSLAGFERPALVVLGKRGPRHAARARTPPGRAPPARATDRAGRQLHAHAAGPARHARAEHPRIRARGGSSTP